MAKGKKETAIRNGCKRGSFFFYTSILHFINLLELIRFAYNDNRFVGVKDRIIEKIQTRFFNKS